MCKFHTSLSVHTRGVYWHRNILAKNHLLQVQTASMPSTNKNTDQDGVDPLDGLVLVPL